MILVVLLKFDFGSCIRNREQAFQANGVEGTISISSVRKKRRKSKDHRICLFLGRTFNIQQLCPERCSI